jgi:hypothetical protein
MAECDLPKVETRVRFPSPAPGMKTIFTAVKKSLSPKLIPFLFLAVPTVLLGMALLFLIIDLDMLIYEGGYIVLPFILISFVSFFFLLKTFWQKSFSGWLAAMLLFTTITFIGDVILGIEYKEQGIKAALNPFILVGGMNLFILFWKRHTFDKRTIAGVIRGVLMTLGISPIAVLISFFVGYPFPYHFDNYRLYSFASQVDTFPLPPNSTWTSETIHGFGQLAGSTNGHCDFVSGRMLSTSLSEAKLAEFYNTYHFKPGDDYLFRTLGEETIPVQIARVTMQGNMVPILHSEVSINLQKLGLSNGDYYWVYLLDWGEKGLTSDTAPNFRWSFDPRCGRLG